MDKEHNPQDRPGINRGKDKVHADEVLPDHESSNSNYAPSRARGKGKNTCCRHERSLSEDSHTREPSYRHGYDLTPSDRSPERSLVRENRRLHKGKVKSQSICNHRDKYSKVQHGDRRRNKVHRAPDHPARRDAGGSSNADLQKQVDELKALLKEITPGRGPVKHITLFPFSDRLRHAEMPRGFRLPKFKTFSGLGDPSNHLKSLTLNSPFGTSTMSYMQERSLAACRVKL
ncbi:hypothetical protein LIER_22822 [Lithospermum erythrorhizon]|uniref:Uncharacterized protein n=1 Tax=Lithospermum erythrorhizon TaxID=34254 RepID=A0AAV3QV73_LITER